MEDLLHHIHIAPSILSADFAHLGDDVAEVLDAGARVVHLDVMDGHFVPNITIGPLVIAALKPLIHGAGALLDVHLMIEHPERYVDAFALAGADVIAVHQETCPHLHRVLAQDGTNAGQQNPRTEGLGDVVISAQLQAGHDIGLFALGRQDDDRLRLEDYEGNEWPW